MLFNTMVPRRRCYADAGDNDDSYCHGKADMTTATEIISVQCCSGPFSVRHCWTLKPSAQTPAYIIPLSYGRVLLNVHILLCYEMQLIEGFSRNIWSKVLGDSGVPRFIYWTSSPACEMGKATMSHEYFSLSLVWPSNLKGEICSASRPWECRW